MATADPHFLSANWPNYMAQLENLLIKIKLKTYLFRIFRDKDAFQFEYDLIQLIF